MAEEARTTRYIIFEDKEENGVNWSIVGSIDAPSGPAALRGFVGDNTGSYAAVAARAFHAHQAARKVSTSWKPLDLGIEDDIEAEAPQTLAV